jgi:beta-1,4-mannooligosaccharide/beta-1,4-mannosyl-N-acetylglucosamine phosphorylase
MDSDNRGALPAAARACRRLPNIPWEDRPAGSSAVVWRSSRNPIIRRDLIERSNSIFNSAVVPFGDGFAGVFRSTTRRA